MRWSALLLVLLKCWAASGQPLLFQRITERDGLVFGEVMDLAIDHQGWLWVGTSMGLCRYDGGTMRTFTKADGLPSPRVNDIEVDSAGLVWLATANGLAQLDPRTDAIRTWSVIPPGSDDPTFNRLVTVKVMGDQVILLSFGGAAVLDLSNESVHRLELDDKGPLHLYGHCALVSDDGNGCWLASTDRGVIHYDAQRRVLRTKGSATMDHPLLGTPASYLLRDHKGRIWTDDVSDGGMNLYVPGSGAVNHWPHVPGAPGLRYTSGMHTIAEDASGRLWLSDWAMRSRILDLRDTTVLELNTVGDDRATLPQGMITATAVDRAGRMWVGTLNGMAVHDPERFAFDRIHWPNDPMAAAGVNGLAEDRKGRVWAVMYPHLVRLTDRGEVAERHTLRHAGGDVAVMDVASGEHGLWVSTSIGLFTFDPSTGKAQHLPEPGTERVDRALGRMVVDAGGNVWFRRLLGDVVRYSPRTGRFRRYARDASMASGPPKGKFMEHLCGRDGTLWIATEDHGLVRMDTTTGRCTSSLQAVRAGHVEGLRVLTLAEDEAGIIWYVADGVGLIRHDPKAGSYQLFDSRQGLPLPSAAGMLFDRNGDLWLGMLNGLVRFDRRTERFVPLDVQRGQEQNDVGRNWLVRSNGEVWMTQWRELIRFMPQAGSRTRPPLSPTITSLSSQGVPLGLPAGDLIRLAPHQDQLLLRYASFAPPGSIVRYAMRSLNDSLWTEASEGEVLLRDLPIGTHGYQFRTRGFDGTWSEATTVRVHREPAWWQRTWARLLAGALMAAAVVFVFRLRLNWIRRRERKEEALARTLNELKLQALRAQMDPHFIFNCLNSIDTYILKEQGDKASHYLNRFARLVRLILHQSDRMSTPVEQEAEMLRYYLELEALRFKHPFTWEVKVDPALLPAEAELPTLLVQPYVENAIWHGLQHKKGPGRISVAFRKLGQELECVIEDDGIGRAASAAINAERRRNHESKAMRLNADRLRIFEETHSKGVRAEITDLEDDEGHALGTRVRLLLPIESLEDEPLPA